MKNTYASLKWIAFLCLSAFSFLAYSQTSDTTKNAPVITTNNNEIEKDNSGSIYSDMGVAVSPASMHLCVKPGTSVSKEITINNSTKKTRKFKIGFADFSMGKNGKPINSSKESKYSLSKWINIAPSYIELKPGEKGKVKLIIAIPDTVNFSAWTIVTVDEVTERPKMDVSNGGNTIAMGVTPSIGFGVYIYQNPPNVKINSVEIQKFQVGKKDRDTTKYFVMDLKNIGDGIGYSAVYVEMTNLSNGKKVRTPSLKFTILPQFSRELFIKFPLNLTSGKYSAIGIVDFGSKDEINGQELEFTIP
ncbi:MAG: hypothetical protein HXX09_10300 [Bacteroidetes bacterium]|nr:hypothetical protein [Bacteroidota bacterium]